MNRKLVISFALAMSSFASVSALAAQQGVVRSRISIPVSLNSLTREATASQPIEVVNAPNVSLTLDSSKFVIPAVSNAPLAFGSLAISGLFDNNLTVCGTEANERCDTATIRLFTTGAGPGIFNAAAGYGMPLTFNLATPSLLDDVVGFGSDNAVTLQSIAIDANRHTVRLADFGAVAASYNFNSDFTDAGAGTFATTIVFEYYLSKAATP